MAKKKKNADFQKVKLKVGRRLPKGLNVTDTSFQTRKILLREQLKEATTSAPTTHRKLGLKDLLSRLAHYSPHTRHESLLGLKELLSGTPTLVKSNLSTLLEKSCPLIVDKDPGVRKAILTVMNIILENTESKLLSPFFPVLSSYVCCAMTHIFPDIRMDSLRFLDLLLERFPDLTVLSGNKIFQLFLDQISIQKDSRTTGAERVLLVNPHDKLTSQRWRTNVLRRMETFLRASLALWDPPKQDSHPEDKELYWDCENPQGVTLYALALDSKPRLSNVFSLHNLGVASGANVQVKDPKVLKEFVSVLMPLLIETWIESSPSSMLFVQQGRDLWDDPTNTMDCILQVSKLLGECVEKIAEDGLTLSWFKGLFARDFQKHIMTWFPYARGSSPPKKKRKSEHPQVSNVQLNLTVCEIYTLLVEEIDPETDVYYQRISEYLTQALINEDLHGVKDITAVVKVVRRLLAASEVNEQLLETLWWLCHHWQAGRKDRAVIVDFFVDLVSSIRHRELISCPAISSWLHSLPKEIVLTAGSPDLLEPLLQRVRKFAARGYPPFLQGLQECDTELVALLANVADSQDSRHLVELCTLLPKLSLQTFRSLAESLRADDGVSVKNISYLLQALNLRLLHKTDPGFNVAEYLGFLQCLIIGVFKHEGNSLQQQYSSNPEWCHLRQFLPTLSHYTIIPSDTDQFDRHFQIIEEVLKILLQFPDTNFLEKSVYSYITSLLESVTHFPMYSVAGIMRLVSAVHTNCNSEADEETSDLLEQLHLALAQLALGTLCTCSGMHIVDQEGRITDDLQDAVLNFIQISECSLLVCELVYQQLQGLASISPEEAECIGGVLLHLLRSGVLENKSMRAVALILRNMQAQVDLDGTEIWWKDLLYEFELRYQRSKKRR